MCGRVKLEGDVSELKIAFRIPPEYPAPNFAPSWNAAPTDSLPIVRNDPKAGHPRNAHWESRVNRAWIARLPITG
jgi:putative SOS response-associated peptidase YedK